VARAGDRRYQALAIEGDRPGDVRGVQSPTRDATRASAHVLAGQRPLKSLAVDETGEIANHTVHSRAAQIHATSLHRPRSNGSGSPHRPLSGELSGVLP